MKKLILATLVALTLAPQMQSQTQPISTMRYLKEYALGFWDLLYGKFYLTRNQNYLRNVVAGYVEKDNRVQKAKELFEQISNCSQEQKVQKIANAIRVNDVRGAFGMIEQNCR